MRAMGSRRYGPVVDTMPAVASSASRSTPATRSTAPLSTISKASLWRSTGTNSNERPVTREMSSNSRAAAPANAPVSGSVYDSGVRNAS